MSRNRKCRCGFIDGLGVTCYMHTPSHLRAQAFPNGDPDAHTWDRVGDAPTPDPRERGEAEFSVCVWCSARVEWMASADRAEAESHLREHSATCPAHPAVVALAALRVPAPSEAVAVEMAKQAALGHTRFCVGVHENGEAEWIEWAEAFRRFTHPAPARGVTVTEAKYREALERIATLTYSEDANERVRLMRKDARAALTPDAEGGR